MLIRHASRFAFVASIIAVVAALFAFAPQCYAAPAVKPCSICRDPRVAEIDKAVLDGETVRAIAKRFELGKTAVGHHAQRHVVRRQLPARPHGNGRGQASAVRELQLGVEVARQHLDETRKTGTLRDVQAALRAYTEAADALGKATGEIRTGANTAGLGRSPDAAVADLHEKALARTPEQIVDLAFGVLVRGLHASDAHARARVDELMRIAPSAAGGEVS